LVVLGIKMARKVTFLVLEEPFRLALPHSGAETRDGGRLFCPVQLVIPLEVDQGGEDVEDDEL
jgi:hypothetical protein